MLIVIENFMPENIMLNINRLYINMEYGRAKIVKGKNWRTMENPNGMMIDFKIVSGWKILPDSRGWYNGT